MKVEDIKIGATYAGGKNGELRTVVRWGASMRWVCWAPTRKRLPLGGFLDTRCTKTASFAKWAEEEVA